MAGLMKQQKIRNWLAPGLAAALPLQAVRSVLTTRVPLSSCAHDVEKRSECLNKHTTTRAFIWASEWWWWWTNECQVKARRWQSSRVDAFASSRIARTRPDVSRVTEDDFHGPEPSALPEILKLSFAKATQQPCWMALDPPFIFGSFPRWARRDNGEIWNEIRPQANTSSSFSPWPFRPLALLPKNRKWAWKTSP